MKNRIDAFERQYLATVCIISCIILGCSIQPRHDIYESLPKHMDLTLEIVRNSGQIVRDEPYWIFLYNASKNTELYDPHLLFFGSELTLSAAKYFSSENIESISEKRINCYLNKDRIYRESWFRNEMPLGYSVNYIDNSAKNEGLGRQSSIIIESIFLDSLADTVRLDVKKSLSKYVGLDWISSNHDVFEIDRFEIPDTLFFPLSRLHFDFESQIISTEEVDQHGRLYWNHMVVYSEGEMKGFYERLWEIIRKGR